MARPTKTGLDYFPLDVDLSDEVEAVESVHGNDGFTVIIKTWQALYKTDSGDLDCSGVLRRKTLAKRANISEELWNNIIGTCVEAGLFDREQWEKHKIITSSGVRKRIGKVMQEREDGRNRMKNRKKNNNTPNNKGKTPEELPKNTGSESETKVKVKDVIVYLNSALNSKYKSGTSKTSSAINARIAEGHTLEDFKTVIDRKSTQWIGTDMAKYLRPETLFGTKFEGYLNELASEEKKSNGTDYGYM